MKLFFTLLTGYLLGTLNPAILLSKIKKTDLRQVGTKNPGATNALLIFGKLSGALVMVFDIAKAFVAVKIAHALFPGNPLIGLLAGAFAVIGHIFPFYLKFRGGKGLASFSGMILGFDPLLFLFLLLLCTTLILVINYSVAMPLTAAALFPILTLTRTHDLLLFGIALAISALIAFKHWSILDKIHAGHEIKVRDYIKTSLFKKGH